MARRVILTLLIWMLLAQAHAAELTPSVTADLVDVANCRAFDGAHDLGSPGAEEIRTVLGLTPGTVKWESPEQAGKDRAFRLAFTQPVAIGTLFTTFNGGASDAARAKLGLGAFVSYLKPDAPYPGDVTKDEQWVRLPAGSVAPLPAGVRTRALRFSDRYATPPSFATRMGVVYLLQERYYNALAIGSSGFAGDPVKPPQRWQGQWGDALPVTGILFYSSHDENIALESLKPDATLPPAVAEERQWKRQPDLHIQPGFNQCRFATPLATRSLKLSIPLPNTVRHIVPLVRLADDAEAPSLQVPPSPFRFAYTMPMDGIMAIEINDKQTGKRVRRLISETARTKGPVNEPWDLTDDSGQTVLPGSYTWKAIARPPFKLTYENTVNHGGQPPWPAIVPGKVHGLWLGDHSAPIATCAVGDLVFLGCPVSEGGESLIAVDHDGKKLWGQGALQLGFFGPKRLATDGRCVYLIKEDFIERVDPQNDFKAVTIYDQKASRDLPGWPMGGAAAKGDKLYIAYSAPPVSWLQPSFTANEMDAKRSIPSIWLKKGGGHRGGREDKNYGEFEYDELMQFYGAFLTEYMPEKCPSLFGAFIPNSVRAFFGDAAEGGPLEGQLMAAFTKPVTVGSVMVPDARVKVYALKPGAKLPEGLPEDAMNEPDLLGGGDAGPEPEPFKEEDWVQLPMTGKAGQPGIALAPEGGLKTQALRFATKRLPFALVTSRRFADIAPQAEKVAGEGAITPSGGWAVTRNPETPLTKYDPAAMALVWKEPVTLRGVSLVQPTPLSTTTVDYWIGPADKDPKEALNDDSCWKQAGVIEPQVFNGYSAEAPSVRNIDFGALVETRAVRVRALEPQGYRQPPYGTHPVNDMHKAGFSAIVAYRHLGGDPELPPTMNERITEYQLPGLDEEKPAVKVLRQLPFRRPGFLAFDKTGALCTVSEGQLVTVPLDGGQPKVIVSREEMAKPAGITDGVQKSFYRWGANWDDRYAGIAFDAAGLIYVADLEANVIKVFDEKTGKYVRLIGTTGGPKLGPFDPAKLEVPTGITVDSAGKLWVAEARWQPKRVTRWSLDGKLEKQFYGPTGYGGGGWLDPKDKSILNFDGMKFVIDWKTKEWKLDSIYHCQSLKGSMYAARPDRVVYYNNRRYLVGDPGGQGSYFNLPVAAVYEERKGVAVPMAAAGNLAPWEDVDRYPDLKKAFGKLERERYGFCWWDKNGDGAPQVDEVQISNTNPLAAGGCFRVGEDLSLNFDGQRLRPTGFTPAGIPMYDLNKAETLPLLKQASWTTTDGRTFITANRLVAPDGKTEIWDHIDKYPTNGGYYSAGMGYNRPPGFLLGEDKPVGHFFLNNAQGKEEEYFVNNSDQGDWFVYTGDGMLAGCIFGGPTGYGLRMWTMPEWEPGKVDLSDLRLFQEHYWGSVGKEDDGKIYAVAGKEHNSIVRVEGLEGLQRLNGEFTVTKEDIEKTQTWSVQKAMVERLLQEPKVAKMVYIEGGVAVNGSLDDWPENLFVTIHDYWVHSLIGSEYVVHSRGALAYNADKLFIAVQAQDDSPLKNSADDLQLLFKGGDAVDVLLGMDPKTDPQRRFPAVGDIRLLISRVKGEPVAMLYKPKAPGAPPEERAHFTSPVGEVYIDVVKQIKDAEVAITAGADAKGKPLWYLEAAIPWKSLGVNPPTMGAKLRGDIGLLQSDQNGVRTVNRLYWSGKSQTVVADIPSEARITPAVWGDFYCMEPDEEMKFGPEDPELLP